MKAMKSASLRGISPSSHSAAARAARPSRAPPRWSCPPAHGAAVGGASVVKKAGSEWRRPAVTGATWLGLGLALALALGLGL